MCGCSGAIPNSVSFQSYSQEIPSVTLSECPSVGDVISLKTRIDNMLNIDDIPPVITKEELLNIYIPALVHSINSGNACGNKQLIEELSSRLN